jgi:hypothetical protein
VLSPFGLTLPATVAELAVTFVAAPVVAVGALAAVERAAKSPTPLKPRSAAITIGRLTNGAYARAMRR